MQRKNLAISGGFVTLGMALRNDPLGHIEMVLSNWPLVWAFVPATGLALTVGGAIWFILSFGIWTRGALHKRVVREQMECTELLDDLAQMLTPRVHGWPAIDYLRQQELVAELKRRQLLPSYAKAGDNSLRDVCERISAIILKYNVKRARKFVKEYLPSPNKEDS